MNEFKKQLKRELDNAKANLKAWQAVEINTTHKKLTNRAIKGAELRNELYTINQTKELVVFYQVESERGYPITENDNVNAWEYTGETVNYIRQAELTSPSAMANRVKEQVEHVEGRVAKIQKAYDEFDRLYAEREALLEKRRAVNREIDDWNSQPIPYSIFIKRDER